MDTAVGVGEGGCGGSLYHHTAALSILYKWSTVQVHHNWTVVCLTRPRVTHTHTHSVRLVCIHVDSSGPLLFIITTSAQLYFGYNL